MSYLNTNIEAAKNSLSEDCLEKIKEAKLPDWAEPITSHDNTLNLLITNGNIKKAMYDIKGYIIDIDKRLHEIELKPSTATLCIGISMGFFLEKALNKADKKHKIIVIEPNFGMIKCAFENCDLSEYIKSHQLIIAPTIEDVAFTLEIINEKHTITDWLVIAEEYTLNHISYEKIAISAMNILNQLRCNIGTVSGAGSKIADNDIANLPYVIHRRGVNELKDLYKDMPAVLISTGPSLNKTLHRLIDIQDKIIIIAVGQALRPLLSYGITPDFICSVDFGEVNMTHYDGLMNSNIPLVALNRSYAPLLKEWQGPMFVSAANIAQAPGQERIHKILQDKGETLQGGSVAHMCYGLGVLLGCNPLIMIGQDLAYDGDKSHFEQADSGGVLKQGLTGAIEWSVKDPRCHLHGSNYTMGPPIKVPGYFGTTATTNTGLASFITSFEGFTKLFKDIQTVNATEGGAHISGTTRMSFKKAIKTYCKKTLDKSAIKPLLSNIDNPMELIKEAIPLLKNEIKILRDLITHTNNGLNNNKKLSTLRNKKWDDTDIKKTNRFNDLLQKNKVISNNAHKLAIQLPLIQLAIYGANRKIQHDEMMVKATNEHISKDIKDARIRIKRNKIILEAANQAAKSLKSTYSGTLEILEKCIENNNLSVLSSYKKYEPDISDAQTYFDAGNFARPMLDAEIILKSEEENKNALDVFTKAVEMRSDIFKKCKKLEDKTDEIDYIELISQGLGIGKDNKDFAECAKLFEKALEINPKGESAMWGLATTYMHLEKYIESIGLYEKLIELNPSAYRYRFEKGQVMICNGNDVEGLKVIQEVMQKTDLFDSFFFVIGDLFYKMKKYQESVMAYQSYLDKFPENYKVWEKLINAAEKAENFYVMAEAEHMFFSLIVDKTAKTMSEMSIENNRL